MASDIGIIYVSAAAVINFQRIHQVAPHYLTLSPYTMAANCTSGLSVKEFLKIGQQLMKLWAKV